jgi:hypothetical protein
LAIRVVAGVGRFYLESLFLSLARRGGRGSVAGSLLFGPLLLVLLAAEA